MSARALLLLFALLAAGCLAPAVVERRASFQVPTTTTHGLFLTRVRLDGREVGPFLIDSGATALVLDVRLAETLGLELWGEGTDPESGLAVRHATIQSLEIGWVRVPRTNVLVMDFSAVSEGFGERLAGVLGYPFFSETVIVVDYPANTVTCVDPRDYRLPRGDWQPLTLWRNVPLLRGRLPGDVEGMFLLDTGSTSPLVLYPHFVRRHPALAIREIRKGRGLRMHGFYDLVEGRVTWFEMAGRRFDQPVVTVARPDTAGGAVPDDFRDGIVGRALLRDFTVVFDYPSSRVAFLKN
jgi:predicted aspartyl protease